MKSIKNYLLESWKWPGSKKKPNNNIIDGSTEGQINEFLQNKCRIKPDAYEITKKGNDYIVNAVKDMYGQIGISFFNSPITSTTNGLFKWGFVGKLMFNNCENLTEIDDFLTDFTELVIIDCPKISKLPQIQTNCQFVHIENTNISDLSGLPKMINGSVKVMKCPNLTSLKGCSEVIRGSFILSRCDKLTSLKYGPRSVAQKYRNLETGCYHVSSCPITDLEGIATLINGSLHLQGCSNLISTKGLSRVKVKYTLAIKDCDKLQTFDEYPLMVADIIVLYNCAKFTKLGAMLKAVRAAVQEEDFGYHCCLALGKCPLENNKAELDELNKINGLGYRYIGYMEDSEKFARNRTSML